MSDNLRDLSFSGAGSSGGGEYKNIRISGAGSINGDVKCQSIMCSGATTVRGRVDCENDIRTSGSSKFEGSVTCESFSCSGSTRIKSIKAESVSSSGSLECFGEISAVNVSGSGATASGAISGETVKLSGSVKVPGLISGDRIEIKYADRLDIGEIGGGFVSILPGLFSHKISNWLFTRNKSIAERMLNIGSIECDEVEIVGCRVNSVKGARIVIGEGCHVGRVEYSESLEVHESAFVGERVKV